MAGLWGLKMLFWAGIIGLTYSQTTKNNNKPTRAPPASTSNETSLTPTPPSNSSDSQASPTGTTVTATTEATETTPEPPKCSYTVTPIEFGLQINVMNFTPGDYNISITEGGRRVIEERVNSTQHNIQRLKPCTEYEHQVVFIHSDGSKTLQCTSTGNKTKTKEMSKTDITGQSSINGCVCYQSNWDISSSISAPNVTSADQCSSGSKSFCVKHRDICSDFETTFTSGNCSSFNITTNIIVDLYNSSEIELSGSTGLPAVIQPTLPTIKECKNITVYYTCSEKDKPGQTNKPLSKLDPFRNYRCTGLISKNNISTDKTTPPVHLNTDCDLKFNIKNKTAMKSIELSWKTTSDNCKDVLHTLRNLSYDCSCSSNDKTGITGIPKPQSDGGTCDFTGLEAFTDYTCGVQPKYNSKTVSKKREVPLRTAPGVPDGSPKVTVTVPENNVIKVECKHGDKIRGPIEKRRFIARLHPGGENKLQNKTVCEFEFKDLSYSTAYRVEVTVFNGYFESQPGRGTADTRYNDKAVIGFLVFLIILTSVALLFVIYKIYILKRRQSHDLGESMMLISTTNDEENLLLVEPIAAEVLLETYKRKLADEGRLFLAEFQSIPRIFSRYTVKEAKKSCNSIKNRYVDILPYDYNRVQLTTGNGEPGCDYINASFVDGFKESKKYIAAQGPKEETINDFWRMIWEQQSSIIVMVTRCEEGNRVKCAQYWPSPDRETELYEEFIVKLNSEDHYPDYTIRRLSLTNKREKNSEREVTHIQFMSWPDHGVPGEPHLLLKLRRRVNAFKNFFSGPIVVHCSAGVGRTGTYIGIDAMMEGLESEGRVDIYGYVVRLRRQRCLMVQVEAQYILIHQALLEHNQFGETEISLSELHSTMNTLKEKNLDDEPTLMEEEFERLPTFKNWRTLNTGVTEENKKKNRSSSVIPYDFNRVLLKLDEGRSQDSDPDEDDEEEDSSDEEDEDSTQYINASHITGYWGCRVFIVAQTPLADTTGDFWSMIYQKKVYTVVMLSDSSEAADCIYWDKEKKSFGEIEVEVTSTDNSPNFIRRTMQIRHVKRKDRREINHFQFLKWTSKEEVPEKPQDLTDMIKDIKQNCGTSRSQRNNPIVVHCDDGSSRSGVFCALWNVLDNAESEKLVDVFQVVKTLRKERQRMVSSLEQYQFIYDAVEAVFPVQNGEVKPVQASAADSVQIVNETKAAEQKDEGKAEEPASTTSNEQQAAAESTPLVPDKEEKKEEAEKEAPPTETTPLDDTSNGPTVTVEV
ncbi:receptor-type tyrosine-protein phosphatase C isoform X2 [Astatotilapia calliptera]|uniref:Receptor-type tyrosine-protein phosphatase C n=1 Tax=Astatotilapia calliptera TaxID=8154 RepID=A0AAX7VIA9_ASTCA|nr:receptor-type tyrosine-protein phosphatase C isoform X2 [Astatotilapia calliptera]